MFNFICGSAQGNIAKALCWRHGHCEMLCKYDAEGVMVCGEQQLNIQIHKEAVTSYSEEETKRN